MFKKMFKNGLNLSSIYRADTLHFKFTTTFTLMEIIARKPKQICKGIQWCVWNSRSALGTMAKAVLFWENACSQLWDI